MGDKTKEIRERMRAMEDEVLSKHGHLVLKYKIPEEEGGIDGEFETFVGTTSLYSQIGPR